MNKITCMAFFYLKYVCTETTDLDKKLEKVKIYFNLKVSDAIKIMYKFLPLLSGAIR